MKIIQKIFIRFNNLLYIFICMLYNKDVINAKKISMHFKILKKIISHVLRVSTYLKVFFLRLQAT